MRKCPPIKKGKRILIICEGYEEYDYIKKLVSLNIWNKSLLIEIKNAKSIDNISSLYAYNYQNKSYELVLVFCDTEMSPYKQFNKLMESINSFHGNFSAKHIVFFANPCTMQIILSHFDKVKITSNDKKKNSVLIQKLTGIKDYEASEKQRAHICSRINIDNYSTMKSNIEGLSNNQVEIPSSNVKELFPYLEAQNTKWIENINKKIEK